jgi:glycogen debranching enzyme
VVFTPRQGKPVEINALWYSALRTGEYLAGKRGEDSSARELKRLAQRVRESFCHVFWYEEGGYCYDVVGPEGPDASLRPNQVIGLALPYSLYPRDKGQQVLEAVSEHLLTPYGLRTLSPEDPRYRGRFEGGMFERDAAYHQGTVWPWLLGPYVSAFFWLQGVAADTRAQAREMLLPLVRSLEEGCVGSIAEVYDGDSPQRPRGCFAQAWSVAEVLRCWKHYGLGEV